MDRTEWFALVDQHTTDGYIDKSGLKAAFIEYLKSDKGQASLKNAVRITIDYGNNIMDNSFPLQDKSLEMIADLVLQEVITG